MFSLRTLKPKNLFKKLKPEIFLLKNT